MSALEVVVASVLITTPVEDLRRERERERERGEGRERGERERERERARETMPNTKVMQKTQRLVLSFFPCTHRTKESIFSFPVSRSPLPAPLHSSHIWLRGVSPSPSVSSHSSAPPPLATCPLKCTSKILQ